jgi:ribose/xylose/arabinose/galactoside ABC-type transport system permease subunit
MANRDGSVITKIGFLIIFVVVIAVFSILNPMFLTPRYFLAMFKNVAIIAIASIGLTFVIAVGHTDLSFYLSAGFSAMFMAWLLSIGAPIPVAVLVALLSGAALGLISGCAVGLARLPDIISTIAIGVIAYGCSFLFSNGQKIYVNKTNISFLNDGTILKLPTPVFFLLILYIIFYIILEKTKYGTFIFSTGSNNIAARYSGINTKLIIVVSYMLSTMIAGFAGMISTASRAQGDVMTTGNFLMPCFTAIFIGSAIFKRPNLLGTFLGAFLVRMMIDGVLLMGIPYYIGDLLTCVLLVISLLISTFNGFGGVKQKKLAASGKMKEGVA